jgi:hypothetical protein
MAIAIVKRRVPVALFETSLKESEQVFFGDLERALRPGPLLERLNIADLVSPAESESSPSSVKASPTEQAGIESLPYTEAQSLAQLFVDRVTAGLRLNTVLEEIGRPRDADEQELSVEEMRDQLRALDVLDSEAVLASFNFHFAFVRFQRLAKPTTLLRLIGGTTPNVGRFFTCCAVEDGASRWLDASDLALPPGNQADMLVAVTVPAGTTIFAGVIADNFASTLGGPVRGGNTQIFIPEPRITCRPSTSVGHSRTRPQRLKHDGNALGVPTTRARKRTLSVRTASTIVTKARRPCRPICGS